MELTARMRQHLKGLAHHLKPVVHVGKDGLTDPVKRQIDEALESHELIKVRLIDGAPLDRASASAALPTATGAFLVQNIGKIFILYRPHPENPQIELPWPVESDEEPPAGDLATARAPKAREEGALLRSVRERGPVAVPPAAKPKPKSGPKPKAAPTASEPRRAAAPRRASKPATSKSKATAPRKMAKPRRGAARRR